MSANPLLALETSRFNDCPLVSSRFRVLEALIDSAWTTKDVSAYTQLSPTRAGIVLSELQRLGWASNDGAEWGRVWSVTPSGFKALRTFVRSLAELVASMPQVSNLQPKEVNNPLRRQVANR